MKFLQNNEKINNNIPLNWGKRSFVILNLKSNYIWFKGGHSSYGSIYCCMFGMILIVLILNLPYFLTVKQVKNTFYKVSKTTILTCKIVNSAEQSKHQLLVFYPTKKVSRLCYPLPLCVLFVNRDIANSNGCWV
jgi:hypothetical protein